MPNPEAKRREIGVLHFRLKDPTKYQQIITITNVERHTPRAMIISKEATGEAVS
jgi:hypothetical protein